MYFDMLKAILSEDHRYRIFLDIKDTLGGKRVAKLHEVLSNNLYDFDREIVSSVQLVHSHEILVWTEPRGSNDDRITFI